MEPQYFISNVLHNKTSFKKGEECPADLIEEFKKKNLISVALPDLAVLSAQAKVDLLKRQLKQAEAELAAQPKAEAPKAEAPKVEPQKGSDKK